MRDRLDEDRMQEDRAHTVRALAFTEHGMQTGGRIREALPQLQLDRCPRGGLASWTAESFESADVIIYIGAVGIAVRAIAPHIVNKLHDPAVLVVDELGHYVIPILSGHVGGANAAAEQVASVLGAEAVITTATDINGKFAVDVWAKHENLTILNKDGIKTVSSRVLRGEPVEVYSRWPIAGKMPEGLELTADLKTAHVVIEYGSADIYKDRLWLAPKCLYVGIGCRRDISQGAIEQLWEDVAGSCGIAAEAVAGVTSIDIKAHEPGLLAFCRAHGWDLTTYDEAQLNAVPGEFHGSAFVKKTVGVDSVCERSAVLAARGARLIVPKTAKNGVTMAIAAEEPQLCWPAETGHTAAEA